jgi:hypothetical protein
LNLSVDSSVPGQQKQRATVQYTIASRCEQVRYQKKRSRVNQKIGGFMDITKEGIPAEAPAPPSLLIEKGANGDGMSPDSQARMDRNDIQGVH